MKKLVLLGTVALAALALTAASATAGADYPAAANVCTGWEAAGSGAFDSLSSLTATGVARAAT